MQEEPTLEQRLAALEQRVAQLETRKPRARRKSRRRDMVPLDRFIAQHNLTPLDFQRAVNAEVLSPAEEVTRTREDGTEETIQCLDGEGRRAFYEALHHSVPTWMNCPICPHELF